ncbi:MAG: hypothetical protein H2057_06775 [Alphaproteobacteria bacterium]|nr:hypothetical protein [Alphaproteobacteria bacterium]
MFTVVTPQDRKIHQRLLDEMFARRDLLFTNGQKSVFDHEYAVYLIYEDKGRGFLGSARLSPTTTPTQSGELLTKRGAKFHDKSVWECSFVFLSRDQKSVNHTPQNDYWFYGLLRDELAKASELFDIAVYLTLSEEGSDQKICLQEKWQFDHSYHFSQGERAEKTLHLGVLNRESFGTLLKSF